MTVKVGTADIARVYVGSTPATKVYLGSTQVWPSGVAPTLTATNVTSTGANLAWTPANAVVTEVGRNGVDSTGGGPWSGPPSALPFAFLIPDTNYVLYAIVNGVRLETQIRTLAEPPPSTSNVPPPVSGNNTTLLQNAFDQAPVGSTLTFPAGATYPHSGVIIVRRALNINGNGSTLQATNDATSSLQIRAHGVSLSNITLGAPLTGPRYVAYEQHRLAVIQSNNFTLTNVTVNGSAGAGMYIDGCANFLLDRPTVKRSRADGIHMTGGSNNGRVLNGLSEDIGDDGVAVVSYGGDPICHDITIESPVVNRQTWGRGISVVGGQNITYRNIKVTGSNGAGIYIACEPSFTTLGVNTVNILGGTLTGCNYNGQVVHGAIMVYNGRSGFTTTNVTFSDLNIVNTPTAAQRHIGINNASGATLSVIAFRNIAIQQSGTQLPVMQSNAPRSSWTASGITVNGNPVTL